MSVKGAEFEATVRPMEGLRLKAGGAYVDSRVDDSFISQDPYGNVINIEGEASPDTPKWQFVSDAEYEHVLTDRLSAFVGGDMSYRTASFAAFGENSGLREYMAYPLVGLRTGIESADGKWRVQLWGRNVFEQVLSAQCLQAGGFGGGQHGYARYLRYYHSRPILSSRARALRLTAR